MDETTSSAENLDMVGHLPIIDRDLKLAFPSLASVHPELAGLSHNPTVVEDNDGVAVCGHLGLESLVLLDLGLQVGGILVVLIAGGLQLLVDPGVQLVGISAEILVSPRILKLLTS